MGISDIGGHSFQKAIDSGLKVGIKDIDAAIEYLQEVKEYLLERVGESAALRDDEIKLPG